MTLTADTLGASRRLTEAPLRDALDRLDRSTRQVCGYHLGLWDTDGSSAAGPGKGVRPALALLSARAASAPVEDAVPAAVACELIHNFSLLHDDVMDGDFERRHRTTAWKVFGSSSAILAGDALQALACEVLAEASTPTSAWAVRCLTATTRRLIAGQSADLAFETRDDVTLTECLQMANDKTGALLACSASLGAVLVDGPAKLALGLADYGGHLGLAFQLVDDLLGIWGEPERTGKPVLSDLRAQKKSVPVVAALESGTSAGARLAELYGRPHALTEHELARAAALVEEAGGRSWTQKAADEEMAAALTSLDSLDLPDDVAAELTELAHLLGRRDH